ncbi:hypothetical protein ACHAP5_012334 [Fusarium lateritium]
MPDQDLPSTPSNGAPPCKHNSTVKGVQVGDPNVPTDTTECGSKHLVTLDTTGLAFRPKDSSKRLSMPNVTVLTVRTQRDSADITRDTSKVTTKSGSMSSSETSTNPPIPPRQHIPDEVLLKHVSDLSKGKPLQEVIRELLQQGIIHEGFVEEELVATLLHASVYNGD